MNLEEHGRMKRELFREEGYEGEELNEKFKIVLKKVEVMRT